jgi:hypothetical protein
LGVRIVARSQDERGNSQCHGDLHTASPQAETETG